jgi:hypothetical protein
VGQPDFSSRGRHDSAAAQRRGLCSTSGKGATLVAEAGAAAPSSHSGSFSNGATDRRLSLALVYLPVAERRVTSVWEAALAATWHGSPVWLHGDVSASNLLLKEGRLSAVIDFGSSGVGDPACDLSIARTLLERESRKVFRATLRADDATWMRGRGWTLWKGLITLAGHLEADSIEARGARRVIAEVLADE